MQLFNWFRGCFDIGEDDEDVNSPNRKGVNQSGSEPFVIKSSRAMEQDASRNEGENSGQSSSLLHQVIPEHKKFLSGPLIPDNAFSPKRVTGNGDRSDATCLYSIDLGLISLALYSEDASEGAVVRRGRFKVTSAELSPKGPTNCIPNPITGGSTNPASLNLSPSAVLPSLQCILQQNTIQRVRLFLHVLSHVIDIASLETSSVFDDCQQEEIVRLIKNLEQTSGKLEDFTEVGINDLLQIAHSSSREKELQFRVLQLQQSIGNLVEELQRQKMKNAQLEKQLNALANNKE
ncbi:serine/threonine-protein kinase OSR1-like [Gossypium australe]|uniref:Serine/threonine-protein kinase OSR1-like n=1 Tax=Gossypium australe TaxID=47621 RepID=A0A5B6W306_9ROSI|nr:serine/threonine-protein kinase OSR1-like [Gossypium australe]